MLGSIIGAIGGLAGGLLGNKSQKDANKANAAAQREFAQNSIQWKAADAEKAGISKVFAMGAPTTSFSPSSVGSNFDFLGNAGQNIGRSMAAGQGPGAAIPALGRAAAAVQLEGLHLDNEFKRTQIASLQKNLTQAGTPAPYSIEGPTMELKTRRDIHDGATPFVVPGSGPDQTLTRTNSGNLTWDTPSQLAESREADPWYKTALGFVRNGILPFANPHTRVPQQVIDELPPGTTPWFNPFTQEWEAVRSRGRHMAIPYGFKQRR